MPKKRAAPPPDADYTWLYSDGSGPVPATDSQAARLVKGDEDAAMLLRAIVKQIGLSAALKLLSEVASESEESRAAKKGAKK